MTVPGDDQRLSLRMRATLAGCLAVAAVASSGCASGSSDAVPSERVKITLVVQNINIRAVGESCAGTGPYTFVHAQSSYRIENSTRVVVADGRMPSGKAIAASNLDWGVAKRVPTLCEFTFDVKVPLNEQEYRFVMDGGSPLTFKRDGSGQARLVFS
jgi:hypothetical protein